MMHYDSLIKHLHGTFKYHIDTYGYDTRPYGEWRGRDGLIHQHKAPVEYAVTWASQQEPDTVERGDIMQWLESLPEGASVIFPQYRGHHLRGEYGFDAKGRTFWYDAK